MMDIASSLDVILWNCKEKKTITLSEMLTISNVLIDMSSNILNISFEDKIHSTVSFIENALQDRSVGFGTVSPFQVTGALNRSESVGDYSVSHLSRYASLGLKFA